MPANIEILSSQREFRREKKDEHTTASYADTGAPCKGVAREDRGGVQRLPRGACRSERRYREGHRDFAEEGTGGRGQEIAARGERRARGKLYSCRREDWCARGD